MTGHYRGRFAPSPTGPLHFGSLVSALISYLDARHFRGEWLVRIEDIDPPRESPGATVTILAQLKAHGLLWDGEVLYQSDRTEAYLEALAKLRREGLLYPCCCTRQQLKDMGGIHRAPCRQASDQPKQEHALRVKVPPGTTVVFDDVIQGLYEQDISSDVGDFVLRRKDRLFAYQLAVVVDDAFQQVSHVIRGRDLLDSTPRQIYLQQALGYATPRYGHHSLVLNVEGQKLSKQNLATAIDNHNAPQNLVAALEWLQLHVPTSLGGRSCEEILDWAVGSWHRSVVQRGVDSQ